MASSKEYANFIMEQLSHLEQISIRKMMGEYLLYYHGTLFGGIYDDRFLVKPVPCVHRLIPGAPKETPYPGAKPMFLVEELEDKEFLAKLICEMEAELPKKRGK